MPPRDDSANAHERPTLRELEVLRALINLGKTTAAAAKLGISQPAVSRAIAQLEQRTELTLFHRESGRLSPTAEGLALARESDPIFQTLERLERVRWRPQEAEPVLRIGAPPTLAFAFLHPLLTEFAKSASDTRVHIEVRSSLELIAMVANGDLDVGMVDSGQQHLGVQFISFRSSQAHAILPTSMPLAAKAQVEPEDFDNLPLIALTRRFPSRTMLDRIFLGANVSPRILIEVSTAISAYDFVKAGLGVAIINPFPLAFGKDGDVVFRPFRPAIAYETSFVLPALVPPVPVARRLIDFVRQNQAEDGYSTALR